MLPLSESTESTDSTLPDMKRSKKRKQKKASQYCCVKSFGPKKNKIVDTKTFLVKFYLGRGKFLECFQKKRNY